MSDYNIRCKCSNIYPEEDFTKHFGKCEEFRKYFKNFDATFGELLKQHSDPKENLLIIRVLLKQYVNLLEKKISSSKSPEIDQLTSHRNTGSSLEKHNLLPNTSRFDSNSNIHPKSNSNIINVDSNVSPNTNHNRNNFNNNGIPINIRSDPIIKNDINQFPQVNNSNQRGPPSFNVNNPFADPFQNDADMLVECCKICNDPNFNYLECIHRICKKCFVDYAKKDFSNMKCVECNTHITETFKKEILGRELYGKLEDDANGKLIGHLIECPQCKEKINYERGAIDYNIKNEKNEKLSKDAAEHYAANRCRCPSCKIDFCVGCKRSPYHISKTCQEQEKILHSKLCRYDNQIITEKNRGPADDVCSNQECMATYSTACTKILKCGHKCWGCKGEKVCPPCLDSNCKDWGSLYDQDEGAYCNICFTEGLGNSPVVLLSCNHYIHQKCLVIRLNKKWIGPKITFNHCLCPQCNNWVDCPSVPEVQKLVLENKALYEDICKKAVERLKFEGLNKDIKLTDPNSKWYRNELAYALNRLSYYMCYQCKKPYFAGLRECGDGPNVNNNNPDREYDPKDLICGAHVNNFGVAGMTECNIHGKEFIEYKCKFCCNIASWFCWGTTHFCEDCHTRQCKGDYVSKYPREKLPKCDKSKCPTKINHPENGEEFGLGCSVCRNNNDNIKDF